MSFDSLNIAAQRFAESNMGEAFSYVSRQGVATSGLSGVFNQVVLDFLVGDFSAKKVTTYTVISSKAQWGTATPDQGGTVTDSSGISYNVNQVSGVSSAGEPAYELAMNKLT